MPQNLSTVYSYLPGYCVPWDCVPKLWVLFTLISLDTVYHGTMPQNLSTVYPYLPGYCVPWDYLPTLWVPFTLISLDTEYHGFMPENFGYCLPLSLLILCTMGLCP